MNATETARVLGRIEGRLTAIELNQQHTREDMTAMREDMKLARKDIGSLNVKTTENRAKISLVASIIALLGVAIPGVFKHL